MRLSVLIPSAIAISVLASCSSNPSVSDSASSVSASSDNGTVITSFAAEPISFDLGSLPAVVTKQVMPGEEAVSVWVDHAQENWDDPVRRQECAMKHPPEFYIQMQKLYAKTQVSWYTVNLSNPHSTVDNSQTSYTLGVYPNLLHEQSSKQIADDFYGCGAGSALLLAFNDRWIVFTGGIGGAFNEGADALEKAIKATLVVHE